MLNWNFATSDRPSLDDQLKAFDARYPQIDDEKLAQMKLCVVNQWFGGKHQFTGVPVHTRDVEAEILKRHPLDIHHLYMSESRGDIPEPEQIETGRLVHHPMPQKLGSLGYFSIPTLRNIQKHARSVFEENDINLVHIRSPNTPLGVITAMVAKDMGIPVAITLHSGTRGGSLPEKRKALIEKLTLPLSRRNAGASFGVSMDAIRILKGDAMYIGNGIDVGFYNPEGVDTKPFFDRYPQTQGKKIIFAPGRIMKAKGQLNVLKSLTQLPTHLQDETMIVFAGNSDINDLDYQRSIDGYIRKMGLASNVLFTGGLEKDWMKLGYAVADLIDSSTYEDACPRVLQEASAMKKPIVASNVGGVPEVLVDKVTGFLVPPGNPSAIAERNMWLLTHPEESRELGENGRRHICTYFSRDKLADRHMRVYSSLL